MSTTHNWAPSGPWIAAQGSSIPQAESLGTSPGLQQGAEASLPAANSAEPEAEEAGSMRESDLSSIPGFRSPSVSQEQAPPAAKPTPASTSPGAPILNHLVEEKGGGFVASLQEQPEAEKKVLVSMPFENLASSVTAQQATWGGRSGRNQIKANRT